MSSASGKQKGCDSCETADKNDLLPAAECAERVKAQFPLWSFDGDVSQTVTERREASGAAEAVKGSTVTATAEVAGGVGTKQAEAGESAEAHGMPCLRRTFVAKDFQAALDFLNAVGKLAEEMGHHPDLHIVSYRTVVVEIYTHSVGGVT